MSANGRFGAWAAIALCLSSTAVDAKTMQITVDRLAFLPAAVDVKVGDTIEWINNDPFDHTATVDGAWEVVIPAHRKARLTLKKSGMLEYYCRYHPHMKGRLSVSPN
jgi:plastocyanin